MIWETHPRNESIRITCGQLIIPPVYVAPTARVRCSVIGEGAQVERMIARNSTAVDSDSGETVLLFNPRLQTRLHGASKEEKNVFDISPSGYGIHWPLLDEDLSILKDTLGIFGKPLIGVPVLSWRCRICQITDSAC